MSNKWILSATEIDTFETCRRKWAYHYLDGIKPMPSKAAEFGSKLHDVLEKYLTGYPIDYQTTEAQVARPGLHFLPKALPKKNVERPIFFIKDNITFHGYIDFFEQLGSQTWLIGDHKTTSDLNRVLTAKALKKNIQANIYAQWAFTEKNAENVRLRWVYYKTKATPKAICVETELNRQEAEEHFSPIAKTADEILSIVKEKPPSSAQPKNLDACFKYGRCPYYTQCKGAGTAALSRTTREGVKNMPNSSPMSKSINNSFHLYVDCVPTKNRHPYEHTIELSELLKPVLTKIHTEKELSHYRLAGYGQHVGLIAHYLSEHLQIKAYDDRTAILSSIKTPEGCDTLQTLIAAAGQVVRGF